MEISVVIVSYNVRYFLEQCLYSVQKALQGISSEIWVIDNHSNDDTVSYLRPKFPKVIFIENQENLGFSRANNQALGSISGDFVHFLNPDTILPEDFYRSSIDFMKTHPRAGAIGPRMLDGSGNFLRESKRGLPGLWSSFCKMSGIWRYFPENRLFSGYYRGDLPENKENPVDVLSGASIIIRRPILEQIGGFDERYFMYGEDIDLSYAVLLSGYENWYIPQTTILHYKGESTIKNEQYWSNFYNAMLLFVEKYQNGGLLKIKKGILAKIIKILSKSSQKATKSSENSRKVNENTENQYFILEENEATTFKQLIHIIKECETRTYFLIHAHGSGSAVGSRHSQDRGVAFSWDEAKTFNRNTTC